MYASLISTLRRIADPIGSVTPTRTVDPNLIVTVNGITDRDKFERIAADFKAHGWNCRPVLAWSDDGKRWIAYTGSHRTFAARAAGIEVPVYEIPRFVMRLAFVILRRNGENPKRLKDNTNEVNSLWMFKKLADEYGLKEFEIPKMLMEIEVK